MSLVKNLTKTLKVTLSPAKKIVMQQATKVQGDVARLSQHLPAPVQHSVAKALGMPNAYPGLNPHIRLLLAVRNQLNQGGLIKTTPEASRAAFRAEMLSLVKKPTPVAAVKDLTLSTEEGPLKARLYQADTKAILPLMVFYHGGAFMTGDVDTHDEACRVLCKHGHFQVLSVEYRLAPEHPAPAASIDAVNACKWAHAHAQELGADPSLICVAGDSAGGNLAAVVAQQLQKTAAAPCAQCLIYPVTESVKDFPSMSTYDKHLFLSMEDHRRAKLAYEGKSLLPPEDPRISPLFGTLTHVAPAIVAVAEFDILRDSGTAYAQALEKAGIPTDFYVVQGQGHGFINITPINRQAYDETAALAKRVSQLFKTIEQRKHAS